MKQLNLYRMPKKSDGSDKFLCTVSVARNFFTRLRGLLGRDPQSFGALLITNCSQIHTFGMSAAIDVAYIGAEGEVVAVQEGLQPGCACKRVKAANDVLELPEGELGRLGIAVGTRLKISKH